MEDKMRAFLNRQYTQLKQDYLHSTSHDQTSKLLAEMDEVMEMIEAFSKISKMIDNLQKK